MDITGTPVYWLPVASQKSTVTISNVQHGVGTNTYASLSPASAETNVSGLNSGVFTALAPDTYLFQVKDANGCTYEEDYRVKPRTNIRDSGQLTADVSCNGASNGSATYTVANNTGAISYVFTTGTVTLALSGNVITATGLVAGNYTLQVTDNTTQCTATASITVAQPAALALTANPFVNANCNSDAKVSVTATGGTAPYQYSFVVASAAGPGTYITANETFLNPATSLNWKVYVKDANGCVIGTPLAISIIKDASPTMTAPAPVCYQGAPIAIDLSLVATVPVAGTAVYRVNGSNITGSVYTVTSPGTYLFSVVDVNGCESNIITYEVKPQVTLVAELLQDLTCTLAADIKLTPGGGTGVYPTYEVEINASGTFVALPAVYTAGTYKFRVTDSQGCQAVSNVITVTPTTTPMASFTQTDVSCIGGNNGSIVVTASNGISPYKYQLSQGATILVAFGTSNTFPGLVAGTYDIQVKDAKDCTSAKVPVTITEPTLLTATSSVTTPLACTAGNAPSKAVVTVVASGGTTPYQYSFDNGVSYSTTNTYETYAGTTFNVLVKDANGCSVTITNGVNVPALDAPTDMDITGTPVYCLPVASQKSTVTISNVQHGVGTKTYAILSPASAVTNVSGLNSGVFTALAPDTYLFQVKDANGCTYEEEYTVKPVTNITVSGQLTADVSCNGGSNGSATFTVANNTGAISYVFTTGTGTLALSGNVITATGLVAGNYTLQVTDNTTQCTATASITVAQPAALALTANPFVNANCNSDAKVSVTATGGTAPYQYSFVVASAAGPGTYITANETFLNPATSLNWKVYVKDANGCVIGTPLAISIIKDASPTMTAPAPVCYQGAPIAIDLSLVATVPVAGTAVYRVNGSNITGSVYTVTSPGTYLFSVVDVNGCESNIITYEVKPQVTLVAELLQDLTCTLAADIKLTPGGGTGVYPTYEVEINASGTFVALPAVYTAGTYKFRVTDSQGCQAVSNVITVTPTTTPMASFTQTDVSCIGGNNGSIVVTASNGISPYKYQLSQGATILVAFGTSNTFPGLVAGTYDIQVKDAKDCTSAKVPVTITEPTLLTATSSVTTPLACTAGNAPSKAVVTVVASGGTTPYQYSFDNGVSYSTTNTYETYAGTTFNVLVKDANGCSVTITNGVNVPALNPPTDMTFATTVPVTCLVKGTVDVTGQSNGVAPFQYEILSPIVRVKQGTTTFANLDPDTYVFQITDANGCTYTESYTLAPVTNITVAGQLVNNVSCNGGTNGSIKFTAENKAGGYTATLSPALGTLTKVGDVVTVTNLPAGPYTLTVVDAITGCTNTATVVVNQPAILDVALVSKTAANCYLGAIVTVKATGGTPAYKYAFVLDGATPTASDYTTSDSAVLDFALGANWDVYVQDANLTCSDILDVTITKDDAPTIDVNANTYCYTGGPVPITITGTTDPDIVKAPTYSIGNGYYASPNFTLNAPGTYTFFIKDGNGCIAKATYVLRQELLIQATLTQDLNCTTNNATVTLTATQGTGAGTYSFEYDRNNSGTYTAVTALPFVTTTPGTYTFRVKDAQCQAVSVPVVITPITTPMFTVDPVNAKCKGDSNGSITVTASNGVAPYQYSINGGAFGSVNIFAGLAAGTYNIAVKDAKNCPATTVPVTIGEPVLLTATHAITPFGCDPSNTAKDAVLTLTAHDGTGPYSYSFDNGVTFGASPSYTMNASATVNYVIVDFNGCRASGSATVPAYNPPTNFNMSATPIYCNTAGGVATVTVNSVTGGVAPYTYAIVDPVASAVSNGTGSFANLLPGTYVVKVTDFNGCSTLNSIEVKKASEISVDAQLLSDVLCNGGTTGSIAFTVSNYISPANYTFVLSPNNGTFTKTGDVVTYTGLTAANYTFTVTDNTSGCTDNVTNFLVKQPTTPLSFTMSATNISCNNKNATITVTAAGGTPAYGYAAVVSGSTAPTTFSTSNKLVVDTNLGTAWDVYVKDLNGCNTLAQTLNILTDALPSAITANVTSQCPSTTGTYEIVVSATGKAPLEYSIGGGFQSSPTFQVNSSGSYDVTVKDANGCTVTVTAAVTISGALDLQLNIQALPSCDAPDGIIVAKANGGSGNYKYTSGAYIPVVVGTTATFNNMSAGSHTVIVEDLTTGCKDIVTVELKEATQITGLALNKTDVTCNGGSNGLIIVNLAPNAPGVNDNPVYTYTLTGTTIGNIPVSVGPQESNVFDNLLPGDYTVLVASGRGCHAQVDTRIIQPSPIVVGAPVVAQFNCTTGTNSTNFASITVNSVTGGTAPYVLYEFSKNGTVVQNSSSNVYNETDLAGGSYTVRVFDSKGCEGSSTAPITIAPFITMTDVSVNVVAPITCIANETIQVSVASTGGTPTGLVYTLTGVSGTVFNQTNPTGLFSGLAIGKYQITVFNPTTGCTIIGFHYVYDPNTFAINATPVNSEVCYGAADGSADLTFVDNLLNPTNDAGAFTYTITGPVPSTGSSANSGPVRISGLLAGQYTVTAKLTNSPECTVTTVFNIKQPIAALTITKSQSPITCAAGNNDGSISVAAAGGWDSNYQYELVGPVSKTYSSVNVFTGLTAGTYTINVKDGKGCIATTTAVLVNPAPIVVNATASATMLSCHGDKSAVITVALPTGGQGSNYMYTLTKVSDNPVSVAGPQANPVFTGLGAGTYTVTVTDGFSCSATSAQIVISEPTIVAASLVQSKTATCNTQAQLTLSAVGGKAPYTYSTNGTTVLGTFTSSVTFNVNPGLYKYYVTDANGCVGFASNEITVPVMIPLTVSLDVSSAIVRCKGDATAILVAKAEGGLGNYVYTLYSGTTGTTVVRPAQNNGSFLDLPIGFYRVAVASGSDCRIVSAPFEITEPKTPFAANFVQKNVSCFGESNGSITVTATGGTGSFKYSISPDSDQFDTKNVFQNLSVGSYTVIAMDENGCNEVRVITITQPPLLKAAEVPNSMIPEVCVGDKDGAFSVEITGGTAPYSVSLDVEKGPFTAGAAGQTIFDFTKLTGGTHTVYYKDAAGCTNAIQIDMPLPVVLDPKVEINYDCVDNKAANRVTVTIDSSIKNPADVDYKLDGTGAYQPSNIFTNVAPGNHYITARHTNGCEVPTVSFQIKAVQPLAIKLAGGKPEMNIITVVGSGGAPAYEYSFNGEPFTSSNTFKIYKSGDYVVVVRDQNGCTATITVPAKYIDICLDNYFTPNGDGVYDTWGPGCTNIYNNLEFSIFDRYGRVVAKYHYGQKWDGRYNGEELPTGDYWYVLKLNDEKDAREFVGHFTLYR
ncbi:T9SS type B sorting domain-containing protein [Flavobacterium sp. LC2016-01]|uniref:T9SS type B sorting domain-containing protein n=1 Tax=Flavobacterium sp. LC2016-01 TaxID=2675876 RepID=UPI001E343CD3|nr:T9SS type B sorting domain-containing protein [Flavobacterium sp. LC2016-01]